MQGRAVAPVALSLLLAACSSSLDLPSITGLWVGPAGVGSATATELTLDVVYVGDVEEGCWSAEGPAGLLPVRWPAGTVVGLEAALEIGDVIVADRDTITGQGVVGEGPLPEDLGQGLPNGCDLSNGYYALEDVAAG